MCDRGGGEYRGLGLEGKCTTGVGGKRMQGYMEVMEKEGNGW